MSTFKKYWWKLSGAGLVAFSVVMSFITPLSPGITEVSPASIAAGPATLTVKGYHTNFSTGTNSFWLTANGRKFQLQGKVISVNSPGEATVAFNIPAELPANDLDLVSDHPGDGTSVLRSAVFVKDVKVTPGLANASGTEITDHQPSHFTFPFKTILYETIRNLNFHVTMWFALLFCMLASVIKSIAYLSKGNLKSDREALEGVNVGLLFGILGLITGSIWARFTWGAWWVNDTKLNGAAISVLIYLAYLLLRNSIGEEQKRARIVAVYNIFAFVMLIVFIQVLPRMTDSLHPGNGGNPAFSQYDLDNNMRMIFYPAVLGWMLIGAWIINLRSRWSHLNHRIHHHA
ncbi:MAG: cytochrome c biogenesis protein CcsA [Bacteroidota bacterium]